MTRISPRPIVLLIFDGWGYRAETEANAIATASTPVFDKLWKICPHTLLAASGESVGLPAGQMGNSEVGHLNLGAGRVVYQDLCRISHAIDTGHFFKNKVLLQTIQQVVDHNKAIHLLGLLSPGGVHSLDRHFDAMVKMAAKQGATKIYIHAFLDGRDTPPRSAIAYIERLEKVLAQVGYGKIVSLIGRFYAMDRDKRWDRIARAYDLLTLGDADIHAETVVSALKKAYDAGDSDEFVRPLSVHVPNELPVTVDDGDAIIFMNFRADRARELSSAFIEPAFVGFERKRIVKLGGYTTLTQYEKTFDVSVAFPPILLKNTLGEYLASQGLRQLRMAETEKYAHVTFFFNGGIEVPNEKEDRILVHSPKVATYDLKPEMSAGELTEKLIESIKSDRYDVVICNFANPDMVGHTGNFEATQQALSYLDRCLRRIIEVLDSVNGEVLITADHGNAELMFDKKTGQPHTAHTHSPVPLIYVSHRSAKLIKQDAALCDVAPTLLYLLGLSIPEAMTGTPIFEIKV
jgi:2,3-bisphosphoglycerate-independent phosphoglycerate mutase